MVSQPFAGWRREGSADVCETNLLGAAAGLVADRLLGEPPAGVHPVARFGQVMARLEGRTYADHRLAGTAHAAAGLAIAATAAAATRVVLRPVGAPAAAGLSTATCTYVAVAGRRLGQAAMAVADALCVDDLVRARALLPTLVGRDPSGLDRAGIARAVVESVAENTVDSVVAPALWAAVAGAPGALVHRAVNTLDAMVGYRDVRYARFGWAAARLDDLAAYAPARATAVLVAACRPEAATGVWRAVRRDAPAHPSPNSGVAEAAFAAALGLRLGGENCYGDRVEHRPALGTGRAPQPTDIARAVRLGRDVTVALVATLALGDAGRRLGRRVRRAA